MNLRPYCHTNDLDHFPPPTTQAALQANGRISKAQALALASTNLETLLGGNLAETRTATDLVATEGGDLLGFEGKVVAVMSARRARVDLF